MSDLLIYIIPALTGLFLFVVSLLIAYTYQYNTKNNFYKTPQIEGDFAPYISPIVNLAIYLFRPLVDKFTPQSVKNEIRTRLNLCGNNKWLGFDEPNFIIVSLLLAIFLGFIGAFLGRQIGNYAVFGIFTGFFMGIILPYSKLDDTVLVRRKQINRNLPVAIDLIALCMRAGLDFQGAVNKVAAELNKENPLKEELEYMVHKLTLGSSRNDALLTLAKRSKSIDVERFVSSVIQGSKKGTPLGETLSIQAKVMRTKRSQAAEQAAARASLLMLGPMMLIFSSVFVLLLGPMIIKFIRGEMM